MKHNLRVLQLQRQLLQVYHLHLLQVQQYPSRDPWTGSVARLVDGPVAESVDGIVKERIKKRKRTTRAEQLLKDAISHYSDLRENWRKFRLRPNTKKGTFPIRVSVEKYTIPSENEVYRFPGLIIFKPNLWYFDTMKFILEHSIPRESVDSVPQSSLQDTSSKNSSGCDELSTEELFSPTLSDHQFEIYHTDCENDNQASGTPSVQQPIQIHSIHRLTTSTDTGKSSLAGSTSICPLKKTNRKKRKFEEDPVTEAAVESLKDIQKALTVNMNAAQNSLNTKKQNSNQSETFANFVGQQLLFIEQQNEELFLDVQHEICDIIYKARKNVLNKNKIFL
ncbi:hypothetical protein ABEB36_003619 [Hypothenemus hampei]|uniref:Uncharacterized protein n=1 Tax=Hypothenemus hampei TaxID=57062 RepID=A0ABD1F9Q9_HYPHA